MLQYIQDCSHRSQGMISDLIWRGHFALCISAYKSILLRCTFSTHSSASVRTCWDHVKPPRCGRLTVTCPAFSRVQWIRPCRARQTPRSFSSFPCRTLTDVESDLTEERSHRNEEQLAKKWGNCWVHQGEDQRESLARQMHQSLLLPQWAEWSVPCGGNPELPELWQFAGDQTVSFTVVCSGLCVADLSSPGRAGWVWPEEIFKIRGGSSEAVTSDQRIQSSRVSKE